jgi:hypothetical protein
MSFVVLLRGEPSNGKSFGSYVLKSLDCFDAVLHTDELYVGYVYTQHRTLYRDNLRYDIWRHYREHREQIERAWEEFLFKIVTNDAAKVKRLLVEGWHLTFCFEKLAQKLTAKGHTVHQVRVEARQYYVATSAGRTLAQLAEWVKAQS